MIFLDSTLLWNNPGGGFGLGIQNCPRMHYSSGTVRDMVTGKTISDRLMLEPKIDWAVLADACSERIIPAGGWIIIDVEGVPRFGAIDLKNPQQWFDYWLELIRAVKA